MLEMLIQYLDELFYGFLIAGEIVEERGKHKLAKILFKIAKAFAWMWCQLFLIVMTGGLYILYLWIKMNRKRRKNRRRA